MIVSAGEVGHSIIVAPQDLASFVKADFADILEDSKVMKLYFVRHGRTVWNQEGRFQGASGGSPLLPESIETLKKLGQYL